MKLPKPNKRNINSLNFDIGKIPPQSKEIEAAILGALLLEKDSYNEVSQMLKPEHFYLDAHQIIYKAIQSLARSNSGIDSLTVVDKLRIDNELEKVGGMYAITQLTKDVASSANIVQHSMRVIEQFVKRELIRIGGETIQNAYEDSSDVFDMLDKSSEGFSNINYDLQNIQTAPLVDLAYNYYQTWNKSERDAGSRIFTGFPEWDEINGPLFNGGVYFIGARPGMGKTAWVIEMIINMASKFPIGFFNLEMSNNQIVQRIISNKQKIDNDVFKLSKQKAPDWLDDKIQKGMNDFVNLNIQIDSKPGTTIEGIKSKAKYWKKKFGIRCLFIDFLQIIQFTEERQRYHDDLSNLNHTLGEIGMLAKGEGVGCRGIPNDN